MTRPMMTFIEARKYLQTVIAQFESVQLQLLAIQLGLPEPVGDAIRLLDVDDETDPVTELRTTVACVLDDNIRPALEDLREVLASAAGSAEEP